MYCIEQNYDSCFQQLGKQLLIMNDQKFQFGYKVHFCFILNIE